MESNKITQAQFDQALELASKLGTSANLIINRIDYIVKTWFRTFAVAYDTWYFDGAEEGDLGDLWSHLDKDTIRSLVVEFPRSFESYSTGARETVIIDKDGNEWCWDGDIPTRWLFEDFEQEILQGKRLYIEKKAEKKLKAKNKREAEKAKTKQMAEQAKKKLTKRELSALKKQLASH